MTKVFLLTGYSVAVVAALVLLLALLGVTAPREFAGNGHYLQYS
jgi:hypothetical protein